MTRTLQTVVLLAALAGAGWLILSRVQTPPPAPNPESTPVVSPPSVSGESSSPPPEPPPAEAPPPWTPDLDPAGKEARSSAHPEPMPSAIRARLETEAERWSFHDADLADEVAGHAARWSDGHDLVARWSLLRALVPRLEEMEPALPEVVEEVRLANGRTLLARRTARIADRWRVTLTSGIDATFSLAEVAEIRPISREMLLESTEKEFRGEAATADRSSPSALLRVLARAHRRGDQELRDELFLAWRQAGGVESLLGVLSPEESVSLQARLERAGERVELAAGPDDSRVASDRPSDLSFAPSGVVPPVSLEELDERLRRSRKQITRRLDEEERKKLFDEFAAYEAWLDRRSARAGADEERIRRLQQELQFLRIDLVKQSGF